MLRTALVAGLRGSGPPLARRGLFTWSLINPKHYGGDAIHKTRYFKENFAIVDAPKAIHSEHGRVMYSEIQADLDQLLYTDWTYLFNPYWADQVHSHVTAFQLLYDGRPPSSPATIVGRLLGQLPNLSDRLEEKQLISEPLKEFQETVEWAYKTEAIYSQIFDQRFHMERAVWEPFERERVLAGLVQLYLDYFQTVPDKFKVKVKRELEYHLFSLRRMVPDCPNVKRAFPTLMA